MSDNILALFEGLNAQQAKELRQRIVPTLTAIRAEITKPKGANKMPIQLTEEEIQEVVQKVFQNLTTPEQPAPATDENLDDVSAELRALYKNPSVNAAKIANLEARSAELWKTHDATKAATQKTDTATQRAQLEIELTPLEDEWNALSKDASRNRARLNELDRAMQALYSKLDKLK